MNRISRISLCFSLVFGGLVVLLTIATSFFSCQLIIGKFSTGHILAILTTAGLVSFSVFLFSTHGFKSVFSLLPTALLAVAESILLVLTFLPEYQYTEHVSADTFNTVVVEEKETSTNTSIQLYKKTCSIFYEPIYRVTLEDDKNLKYSFGDYTISFEGQDIRLNLPIHSKTPIVIKCSE